MPRTTLHTHIVAVGYEKANGVTVTADRFTGIACARIARCNGLPVSGMLVRTVLEGRMKGWFSGPENDLQVDVIEDSESPCPFGIPWVWRAVGWREWLGQGQHGQHIDLVACDSCCGV